MTTLAQNWWSYVLRGVLAVLFGALAYLWPGVTIASFVLLFGAYALLDGISYVVAVFRPPPGASRVPLVIGAILSVLAAIVVFTMPGLSTVFLLYVVAVWAIAVGIAQIIAAIQLRKVVEGEWLLALAGVLSVLLGLFMFARPAAGVLGLVWAIALYAVVEGVTLIVLGVRLRSWAKDGGATYTGRRATASLP